MLRVVLYLAIVAGAVGWHQPLAFAPSSSHFLVQNRERSSGGLALSMNLPSSRRDALSLGVGLALGIGAQRPAAAFENRSAPKGKFPPTAGTPYKGVGKGPKDGNLPICTGEPNCFSSGVSPEEDPEHFYPPFKYTGKTKEEAMKELIAAVEAYPPGQGKIDGGGFKIFKSTPEYLWTQFESAKRGYVDDLEFALVKDGEVQVRTASRLGYLDFQVNSKRLNWFVEHLSKEKGWECKKVDKDAYPRYFAENGER